MDKTNYLAIMSQLQRVSSMLPGEQENFLARTLHPTHYGRFCPIETPEGTEIGLRKNLALLAKISLTWIGLLFDREDQVCSWSFSLLPITKSTSPILAYFWGLICAAHPVTMIFFSG